MKTMLTVETALERGRLNNFNILRLTAAYAVVFSHAWPLALGADEIDPVEAVLGMSLGGISVLVFFFISGLLISQSAHRSSTSRMDFVLARVFRIFPGLLVALIVTSLLASLSGGDFSVSEGLIYVIRGFSLFSVQHDLRGAFASNPYPFVVNGPIWTLFYEVVCYFLLAGAVWMGLLRHWVGWVFAISVTLGVWFAFEVLDLMGGALAYRLSVFIPLAIAFLAGSVSWWLRARIALNWFFAAILVTCTVFSQGLTIFLPVFVVTLGYTVLLLAYRLPVLKLENDISYGVYIYGWPIAQTIVAVLADISHFELAIVSGLVVLPIAIASWFFVEKPALTAARRLKIVRLVKLSNQLI